MRRAVSRRHARSIEIGPWSNTRARSGSYEFVRDFPVAHDTKSSGRRIRAVLISLAARASFAPHVTHAADATAAAPVVARPRIGLALSGGGIRSSTFNLGQLTGLNEPNLMPLNDYMANVS